PGGARGQSRGSGPGSAPWISAAGRGQQAESPRAIGAVRAVTVETERGEGKAMQRSQQLQSRGAAGSGSPRGLRRIAGVRDWRVRNKLIIAMIGLVLIPVLVLSLTAQSTLSRTLTRTQETSLYNDTSATTNEIEAVLQRDLALV